MADRRLAPDLLAAAGASRPIEAVMLENVPAVVGVLDAQGRVVELNRAGGELMGVSGVEVCGRGLWESGLVVEGEESDRREVLAGLDAGDCPSRDESLWIAKDGRWRQVSWRYSGSRTGTARSPA